MNIEKGIPIPRDGIGSGRWENVARAMEHSDSIVLKDSLEIRKARAAFSQLERRGENGFRFVSRKQPDGAVRIWKIQKDGAE